MKFGIGNFNKVAKEAYEKLPLNERNELIDEAKDGISETLNSRSIQKRGSKIFGKINSMV